MTTLKERVGVTPIAEKESRSAGRPSKIRD